MRSLKSKFIVVISSLIILTLVVTGYFLIDQKKRELTFDIYRSTRSFSGFIVHHILDDYKLYYVSKSFSFFQRAMTNTFSMNPDIKSIQMADYEGNLLYDSVQEKDRQYVGEPRRVYGDLVARVKDVKASVKTTDRIVFLIKNNDGSYRHVDNLENDVEPLSDKERVINIVRPVGDNEHWVIFGISYDELDERVWAAFMRIVVILLFISLAGIIVAIILSGNIIKPLNDLTKGVLEIARGNLKYKVKVTTKDEIKTLADGFNQMGEDLEIATKAMIEKERISKELEIAGNIQANLLPKVPVIRGLDVMASVQPAEEVGGDCYDFLTLDECNTLLYLGDVTGHGVPASLVVAIANSLFYTMTDFFKNTKDIIVATNKILKVKTEPTMFITAVLCNWNCEKEELTYTSAGHEQMIHYKAKKQEIALCPAGGMALGMLPDISKNVSETKLDFQPDDVLIIYSDGIPEAWKSGTENLGMERFQEIVEKHMELPTAKEIHDAILKDVYAFMGNYPQADDITLMVIKRGITEIA